MSNTTTIARATSAEIQHILTDYEIHLTGSEDGTTTQLPSLHQNRHSAAENLHNWPSNYRRVPDYRPINRELNFSERPLGNSTFEFLFLNVMFTGVATNASIAKFWGRTGGKVFTRMFRYSIGGEW